MLVTCPDRVGELKPEEHALDVDTIHMTVNTLLNRKKHIRRRQQGSIQQFLRNQTKRKKKKT